MLRRNLLREAGTPRFRGYVTACVHVLRVHPCGVVNRSRINLFKQIRLPADVDDLTD
jgi:hypothetical protein